MANLLTRLQEFNLESGRYGVISKRISFLYNLFMHYYIIIRTHTLSGFTLGNCDCVLRIRSVSRWSLAQELSFLCMRHETSSAAAAAAVAVQCWHILRVSFLLAPIAFMSCPPSPFPWSHTPFPLLFRSPFQRASCYTIEPSRMPRLKPGRLGVKCACA